MMRSKDLRASLYLVGRFYKPYWKISFFLIIISMIGAAMASFQPLFIAPALDAALMTNIEPARSLSEIDLNNLGPTILSTFSSGNTDNRFNLILITAIMFVAVATIAAVLEFVAYLLSAWIGSLVKALISGNSAGRNFFIGRVPKFIQLDDIIVPPMQSPTVKN